MLLLITNFSAISPNIILWRNNKKNRHNLVNDGQSKNAELIK